MWMMMWKNRGIGLGLLRVHNANEQFHPDCISGRSYCHTLHCDVVNFFECAFRAESDTDLQMQRSITHATFEYARDGEEFISYLSLSETARQH
jgi:hypothetical protein